MKRSQRADAVRQIGYNLLSFQLAGSCCLSLLCRLRKGPEKAAGLRWELVELPCGPEVPVCDSPERIYDYWVANVMTASWYNPDAECCCAIHLNTCRRATGFHLVGIGTLDSVLIQPREVYRTAIVRASASIVIAHNHPSGCPEPCEADIRATRDLMRAGEVLKIALVDHAIIGRAGSYHSAPWVSLRGLGYFA